MSDQIVTLLPLNTAFRFYAFVIPATAEFVVFSSDVGRQTLRRFGLHGKLYRYWVTALAEHIEPMGKIIV